MSDFMEWCREVALTSGLPLEEFSDGTFALAVERPSGTWRINFLPADGWVLLRAPLARPSEHPSLRHRALRQNLELAFFRYAEREGEDVLMLCGDYPDPEPNAEEFAGIVRQAVVALDHSITALGLTAPPEV